MIHLPLLHTLKVEGYGLFPGAEPGDGLRASFNPGLTLVLGANGLGKTTLVTLLFRMFSGPQDISALLGSSDLGTASLKVTSLRPKLRRTLADRVADGATNAVATLVFDLGDERVSIERKLRDLTLQSLTIGSEEFPSTEDTYKSEMARLSGVSTFDDWILLLRYIVFFPENRRSLVWDPSAQRHLLRILFLDSKASKLWVGRERDILKTDTRMRNLRAVVTQEERALREAESNIQTEFDARTELDQLREQQAKNEETYRNMRSSLDDVVAEHEQTRLRFLQLEKEQGLRHRELERRQLLAIGAHFPASSDSARYILSQLLVDGDCLACGCSVPEMTNTFRDRIATNRCAICGSGISPRAPTLPEEDRSVPIDRLEENLSKITNEMENVRPLLDAAEERRSKMLEDSRELQALLRTTSKRMDELRTELPPDEVDIHEKREDLNSLRFSLEQLQQELDLKRAAFDEIVVDAASTVAKQSARVQAVFQEYAQQFLFEACRLVYSPYSARLGQEGRRFAFPAFELELEGSDFSHAVRRQGPGDVSESQREFIDLSFRMALAEVATDAGITSLVVDAPESSLDSVFEERAAEVLGEFGMSEKGNRLIIASNISGDLIPKLLRKACPDNEWRHRIVDLLSIAAPTAATKTLREEYQSAKDRLLQERDG